MSMTTASLRGSSNREKRTEKDSELIGNVKVDNESDGRPGVSNEDKSVFPSGAVYPQPKGIVKVASFTGSESNNSNSK